MLAKIEALIARAAHPDTPVEEARTSAVIAAKLIREHEVVLVEKNGARGSGRLWPGSPGGDSIVDISDIIDMIFRNQERRRPRPPPPPPPKKRRTRGPKGQPARCKHGEPLWKECPACRSDREEKRPSKCDHGKVWPTCDICWPGDFFGGKHQEFRHRKVWTAICPRLLYQQHIPCACCGGPIVGGDKMCWVGGEAVSVNSKITHERCVAHWSASECMRCGKRTDT